MIISLSSNLGTLGFPFHYERTRYLSIQQVTQRVKDLRRMLTSDPSHVLYPFPQVLFHLGSIKILNVLFLKLQEFRERNKAFFWSSPAEHLFNGTLSIYPFRFPTA